MIKIKNYRKKLLIGSVILSQLWINPQAFAQTTPEYKGKIGRTLTDSKEYWAEPNKAPSGAPNVVWILLDDVGFGATSAFGGLINTPTFDSLANNGLRYTNFHTAAICAPTRASLLTGRNAHAVHVGGFSHTLMSAGFPGWDGRLPSSAGTVAEILRDNGYNTFAVGKYGITPDEEASDAGPFDHWPTGKGFDHFYGFLGSETDQYDPDLVEDQTWVNGGTSLARFADKEVNEGSLYKGDLKGKHLSELITDKSISYIDRQKKVAPDKPFFLYYSPGATHAPHQVEAPWREKYKGKFDEGWDVFREKVFAKQKKLGIIPANAVLPERHASIKAWNSLSSDEKRLYARYMEVYAGFLEYTDYEVSRLINHLKKINQFDNTLFFVILGDNGASKEGGFVGTSDVPLFKSIFNPKSEAEVVKENLAKIDLLGTPKAIEGNYPLGWAQAANTPFKYWKQDAQSEGGTRNPLIVFYPKGIKAKGEIRTQYGHVNDILPTTLDFLGIQTLKQIRGISQDSIHGKSLVYSFADAKAASQHTLQYYYIFGSRSIYKDGWKAGAAHHPDFIDVIQARSEGKKPVKADFEADVWELYDLNNDFNETTNLASKYPEKLKELKALFEEQAAKNNLYPFISWEDVLNRRIHKTQSQNQNKSNGTH